jgi:hypothetical protein
MYVLMRFSLAVCKDPNFVEPKSFCKIFDLKDGSYKHVGAISTWLLLTGEFSKVELVPYSGIRPMCA